MAGRKRLVPKEDLKAELQKFAADIVRADGAIPGPRQPVWKEISSALQKKHPCGKPLSCQTIYQYVLRNTDDSLTELHSICGICLPTPSLCIDRTDYDSTSSSSAGSISTVEDRGDSVIASGKETFKIRIKPQSWLSMKPEIRRFVRNDRSSDRILPTMPPYRWEDTVMDMLWEQFKLPCPYIFKRAHVSHHPDRAEYIKIEAMCKECGSDAVGQIFEEPEDGADVILHWTSRDTRGLPHESKRPLQGDERRKVASSILQGSASLYRRHQAKELMTQGDVEPPKLYTVDVLRKAKQQESYKVLDIVEGSDPIMNLQRMKNGNEYAGHIQDIGLDRFYVRYCTESQTVVFKEHRKSTYTAIAIDATGSLVKKPRKESEVTSHVFLYEGVLHTGSVQLPVFQWLSERQDANHITFMLSEWLLSVGGKGPNEVVCDNSAALKSAIARALCLCVDYASCKEMYFAYLVKRTRVLPKCFLRLDVAHFLAAARKWSCWKEKSFQRLSGFYLRCLGLLVTSTTIDCFAEILRYILILALSEYEGLDAFGDQLPMEDSLTYLTRAIRMGVNLETCVDDDKVQLAERECLPDYDTDEPLDSSSSVTINAWLEGIKNEVENLTKDSKGTRLNPYYAPQVAAHFLRVSREFPVWSAVMVEPFRSPYLTASSATVESDFKDLKNNILLGLSRPMRIDKFVAIHIKSIEGSCRIAGAPAKRLTTERAGITRMAEIASKSATVTSKPSAASSEDCQVLHVKPSEIQMRNDCLLFLDGESDEIVEKTGSSEVCMVGTTGKDIEDPFLTSSEKDDEPFSSVPTASNDEEHENFQEAEHFDSAEEKKTHEGAPRLDQTTIPVQADMDKRTTVINNYKSTGTENSSVTEPTNTHGELQTPFDLLTKEDWRGKGEPQSKKQILISKYLTKCPELEVAVQSGQVKEPSKRLLKNGNCAGFISTDKNTSVLIRNTCAFDALCQIFTSAYVDSEAYRNAIHVSGNAILRTSQSLAMHGAVKRTYLARTEALLKSGDQILVDSGNLPLPQKATRGAKVTKPTATVYDAVCNVSKLAQSLFKTAPSLSITYDCDKEKCNGIKTLTVPIIEIEMGYLHKNGLNNLEEGIFSSLKMDKETQICNNCNSAVTCQWGNHIITDTEFLAVDRRAAEAMLGNKSQHNRPHTLIELPRNLKIKEKTYDLAGAVVHEPGHYIAYVWRKANYWEKANDLAKHIEKVRDTSQQVCPHLLVYVRAH